MDYPKLDYDSEIFDGICRQNLRGLSTWQLVAEQQSVRQQVEDWESIKSCGGMCDLQLGVAVRYSDCIQLEIKRRSQFEISSKAQAASIEIRALKERCTGHDFLDVCGHYVEVSAVGGSFKFKCPIHGDDHPSGQFYPTEGKWHCFGCSKGGDVFDFLMVYGRLSFGEATGLLGKLYGFRVGRG